MRLSSTLVFVERVLEATGRVREVIEHDLPADVAGRVGETMRKRRRRRYEKQPRRLGAIRRSDDGASGLSSLTTILVDVHDAGGWRAHVRVTGRRSPTFPLGYSSLGPLRTDETAADVK
jgi:hypothetical protein